MADRPEYLLYCMAQSGNAYRVALMLNLIGADWKPVFVDFFGAGEQRTEKYRTEVNEMGEIPVLDHGGRKLSQSAVCLTYLAKRSGKFRPEGEDEEFECLRWLVFDNQNTWCRLPRPLQPNGGKRFLGPGQLHHFCIRSRKRAFGQSKSIGHGKFHDKARASLLGNQMGQLPAVLADKAQRDRETKSSAGSRRFGSEEWIVDSTLNRSGDSWPVIQDFHANVVIIHAACAHNDAAAFSTLLDGLLGILQ